MVSLKVLRVAAWLLIGWMTSFYACLARIGGRTSADGPFILDDVEDLNLVAMGVERDWISDYIHPSGNVLSVLNLNASGLTLAQGQTPIGALIATIPSKSGYVSGGFGVPMPAVKGASTLTDPGNISSFVSLGFLACFEPVLQNQIFEVHLETYPGPPYPKIVWAFTPASGKTFSAVEVNLRSPSRIENSQGINLDDLLSATRFLYFYSFGSVPNPTTFQLRIDDITLTGVYEPIRTPTPSPSPIPPTETPVIPPTPDCTEDFDGDWVCDAQEMGPYVYSGRTNLYLPDSDGDGLWDGIEDANRNGTRDPGETNARSRDSDGDGFEDGIEVFFIGSGPLDDTDPDIPFVDADGDGLPDSLDTNDGNPDRDGDRYLDGFDAGWFQNLAAADDPARIPQLGNVMENPNDPPNIVDNADSQMVLNFFGNLPASEAFSPFNADVNRDAHIDNADSQLILQFFGRLVVLLPFHADIPE